MIEVINKYHYEDYEPAALEILSKRQKLRVLKVNNFYSLPTNVELKTVSGGVLLQSPNPPINDSVSHSKSLLLLL